MNPEQTRSPWRRDPEFRELIHDLKNIVTPIQGYTLLLKHQLDRLDDEKRAEVLSRLEGQVDHLRRKLRKL